MAYQDPKKILAKNILFVTAHPDDETLLAGGTIFKNHQFGGSNTVWSATRGERGSAYLKDAVSPRELGSIRTKELTKAADILGIDRVVVEDFPDGEVASHQPEIQNKLQKFVEDCDFDVVIGFGPDGYTGHRDHIAMGEVAKSTARSRDISFVSISMPPHSKFPDFRIHLLSKQKEGNYEDCGSWQEPNMQIATDSDKKLQALKAYETQFDGLDPFKVFPENVAKHILNYEYFFV